MRNPLIYLLILLEYAILASTFTLAKKTLNFSPPVFLIAIRLLLAGSLLCTYSVMRKQISWAKVKEDAGLFIQVGLFHAYLAFIPEFWALQFMSSAKVSIIYAITPFIAAVLSWLLYRERLSWNQILAMVIALGALLPLVLLESDPAELATIAEISLPELVLFGSVSSAAYAWFVVKRLMNAGHSLAFINGVAMLLGGLLATPTALWFEGRPWEAVSDWWQFLSWLGLLILAAHVVSFNLYGWILTRVSITLMMFCGFLCPIFSTVFGWAFLNEGFTWHAFTALAGLTVGLALFTWVPRKIPSFH